MCPTGRNCRVVLLPLTDKRIIGIDPGDPPGPTQRASGPVQHIFSAARPAALGYFERAQTKRQALVPAGWQPHTRIDDMANPTSGICSTVAARSSFIFGSGHAAARPRPPPLIEEFPRHCRRRPRYPAGARAPGGRGASSCMSAVLYCRYCRFCDQFFRQLRRVFKNILIGESYFHVRREVVIASRAGQSHVLSRRFLPLQA